MKKNLSVGMLFLALIGTSRADDLADLLQDLAIQTACLGMYSSAETGVNVTSRYDDPPDWYVPSMMANRFAVMSGDMTRISTFYGVCFDYAQFAWDDIKRYQESYNQAGMKGQQWYIAAADKGDPYTIILYDPVSPEKSTTVSNGVYLKENSRHNVYTHDGAEGHAWLWVQHNNGTWYWIDPTWTDNFGYVWWGMVENGKEVQYYPDPVYCIASDYPKPGITGTGTRSPDSTYTESPSTGAGLAHLGYYVGYVRAFDYGDPAADGHYVIFDKSGLSFSIEDQFPGAFSLFSFSVDWLRYAGNERAANGTASFTDDSFLFGTALGFPIFSVFTIYAGGGLGFTFREYGGYSGSGGDIPDSRFEFAWKVNTGLRLQVSSFFTKFDVSWGTIIGPAFGLGIGIFI
jgi:hypothetical protein